MKTKVLIDLDVVTVAAMEKREGKFECLTHLPIERITILKELSNKVLRRNRLPEVKIINHYEDFNSLESQFKYSLVKLPFILSASFIGSVSFFTSFTNFNFKSIKYNSFSHSCALKTLIPLLQTYLLGGEYEGEN